jgi:hypothetical protein
MDRGHVIMCTCLHAYAHSFYAENWFVMFICHTRVVLRAVSVARALVTMRGDIAAEVNVFHSTGD